MVALVPAVMLEGMLRSLMQRGPRPVARKGRRMMVLKAPPGESPMARRTSTLVEMWPRLTGFLLVE
jgi:hypothetical protein